MKYVCREGSCEYIEDTLNELKKTHNIKVVDTTSTGDGRICVLMETTKIIARPTDAMGLVDLAEEVVARWNAEFSTSLRVTESLKRELGARRKSFTDKELLEALDKRVQVVNTNPWYKGEGARHKTRITLLYRTDKAVEDALNADLSLWEDIAERQSKLIKPKRMSGNTNILK